MTTFVLVPGFWLGAWAWDEVAAALRGWGHDVLAVTPAGMAERRGDADGVTIETQVEDLVTTLRGHAGDPVVLVGHSGGGPLVAEAAAVVLRTLDEHGGQYPMPTLAELGGAATGIAEDDFARIRARSTPEPGGVVLRPARRAAEPDPTLPKTVIACTFTGDDVRGAVEAGAPAFAEMAGPEWSVRELTTGHWPMFSEPVALARLLAEIGAGTRRP